MQWARQKLGMAPPPAAEPVVPNGARLIQANRVKARALEQQIGDIEYEIDEMVNSGAKDSFIRVKLGEKAALQANLISLKQQIANLEAQDRLVSTAYNNKEQALLTKHSAAQTKALVDETEKIDIHGAVDDMRDAMTDVNEHSRALAEPMFVQEDDGGVDAELEMLKQRVADKKAAEMPTIVKRKVAKVAVKNKINEGV